MFSGVLTGLAMVIATTFSFGFIHYALYKADPASFETTSSPSLFTFFYYSFNTFVFNSIKELVPISMVSQAASMLEGFFAFFLIGLFISLVLPFRTQRYTTELTEAIRTIESEGASIENFIRSEYKVETVDAAIRQLEKLEANLTSLLLFLSEGLSPAAERTSAAEGSSGPMATPSPPVAGPPGASFASQVVVDPPNERLGVPKAPRRRRRAKPSAKPTE
jgi:hypothetical protein